MRATGIVRRIDDLGRIVIPLEIRRTFNIKGGDPLEIYTESDGRVIFQKYSALGNIANYAKNASDALRMNGITAAVFDSFGDYVSGASSLKIYHDKLCENLDERKFWQLPDVIGVYCQPILSNGAIIGYIVFVDGNNSYAAIVKSIATMLGLALSC